MAKHLTETNNYWIYWVCWVGPIKPINPIIRGPGGETLIFSRIRVRRLLTTHFLEETPGPLSLLDLLGGPAGTNETNETNETNKPYNFLLGGE